jgi:FkbM family methyltransferase
MPTSFANSKDIEEALDDRFDETALAHSYQTLSRVDRARVLEFIRGIRNERFERPWEREFNIETRQADIANCFRLLLGREPSSHLEWRDHGDEAGEELSNVVRRYLTSLEFSRRDLLNAEKPGSIATKSFDGFSIYAGRDDRATGEHILFGSYEPHVTAAFRHYLRPGMNVADIGANVGYFTMLAASIVGSSGIVTAVEANPDNARLIEASRRLNGFEHIRIANVAAGRNVGLLLLKTLWSNGITIELESESDLWNSRIVPCIPLGRLLPVNTRLDFVKIDIEGAEYSALVGCEEILRRDSPIIISEFTPGALPGISGVDGETYLRFLIACGLDLAVVHHQGEIQRFGGDALGVMRAWEDAKVDHIDIIAAPANVI